MSRSQRRENTMKLNTKSAIAGFTSAVFFALPAMSAPISVFPKDLVNFLRLTRIRLCKSGAAAEAAAPAEAAALAEVAQFGVVARIAVVSCIVVAPGIAE